MPTARAWAAPGLVRLRAGDATIRTDFASFDDYWARFDGGDGTIPAYLRSVPSATRDQIKDAVRAPIWTGGRRAALLYGNDLVVTWTKPAATRS